VQRIFTPEHPIFSLAAQMRMRYQWEMGERENGEWGERGMGGRGMGGRGMGGRGTEGMVGRGGGEEMGDGGGDGGGLPDSINHNFVVCTTSTFRYST
jgi:hypothetical protein